jgi:hypothetical protein
LVVSTPLKNMKVSWDDYSHIYGKIKHVPNHQPVIDSGMLLIFSEMMILFSVCFLLSFLMLHHY